MKKKKSNYNKLINLMLLGTALAIIFLISSFSFLISIVEKPLMALIKEAFH